MPRRFNPMNRHKKTGQEAPGSILESGGARRDRTADLYNAIVALSQLSYGPVFARLFREAAH